MQPPFKRVAILGLGLIGSSLARALTSHAKGIHIAGFDLSHDTLSYALSQGFIRSQHAHAGQAAHEADVVILATPLPGFATLAADIAPFLKPGCLVMDTGSVKREPMHAINQYIHNPAFYIPAHPICGGEQSGVHAGTAELFLGKRIILTPPEEELRSPFIAQARSFWEQVGGRVEFMPAEMHDRIYAYVSHMPHLVAFASRKPLQGLQGVYGESTQRFMRLMKSDAALWTEICMANNDYVLEAIHDFMTFAHQMEKELSEVPASGAADANLAVSLFPKIIATCLIATASLLQEITGVHPARYAGTGFADITAPALADPDAALSAISSHHWVIAAMLRATLESLRAMHEALQNGEPSKLRALLK